MELPRCWEEQKEWAKIAKEEQRERDRREREAARGDREQQIMTDDEYIMTDDEYRALMKELDRWQEDLFREEEKESDAQSEVHEAEDESQEEECGDSGSDEDWTLEVAESSSDSDDHQEELGDVVELVTDDQATEPESEPEEKGEVEVEKASLKRDKADLQEQLKNHCVEIESLEKGKTELTQEHNQLKMDFEQVRLERDNLTKDRQLVQSQQTESDRNKLSLQRKLFALTQGSAVISTSLRKAGEENKYFTVDIEELESHNAVSIAAERAEKQTQLSVSQQEVKQSVQEKEERVVKWKVSQFKFLFNI